MSFLSLKQTKQEQEIDAAVRGRRQNQQNESFLSKFVFVGYAIIMCFSFKEGDIDK